MNSWDIKRISCSISNTVLDTILRRLKKTAIGLSVHDLPDITPNLTPKKLNQSDGAKIFL